MIAASVARLSTWGGYNSVRLDHSPRAVSVWKAARMTRSTAS